MFGWVIKYIHVLSIFVYLFCKIPFSLYFGKITTYIVIPNTVHNLSAIYINELKDYKQNLFVLRSVQLVLFCQKSKLTEKIKTLNSFMSWKLHLNSRFIKSKLKLQIIIYKQQFLNKSGIWNLLLNSEDFYKHKTIHYSNVENSPDCQYRVFIILHTYHV